MADNYLITGYHGTPHVTAENDRGIHAAIFGTGRFVLPVGKQFEAEYIGNNTIRVYDGKLMDNGAAAGIPAGGFIDLSISNTSQGMKRNDIIAFQYAQDESTKTETGSFVVIQGLETASTPADPELSQSDLLSNTAKFDQMALYRVAVSGTTIAEPVKLFGVTENFPSLVPIARKIAGLGLDADITVAALLAALKAYYQGGSDVAVADGGTGASTAEGARENLGAAPTNHTHAYNSLTGLPNIPSSASDIGAKATGTVESIATGGTGATDAATARANLGITPANIGAAPAGYGLGNSVLCDWATVDYITSPGWYKFQGAVSTGGMTFNSPFMRVGSWDANHATQVISPHGSEAVRLTRRNTGGVWGEWEWINPPMRTGVEYRTTERWDGKAVYTINIDQGNSASGTTIVDTQIAATAIVRVGGAMGRFGNPFIHTDEAYSIWGTAQVSDGNIRTQIHAGSNMVNLKCNLHVWYTKE